MRILALVMVLALIGCTTPDRRTIIQPPAPQLPFELAAPCAPPVKLPQSALGRDDTFRYWGADRYALAECADRHRAIVEAWGVGRVQ